jgi:hypothetical protein
MAPEFTKEPTQRQIDLLNKADPRYFAIAPAGTGLGMLSAYVDDDGRRLNFGMPSGPALFLSLSRRAWLASERLLNQDVFEYDSIAKYWGPTDHAHLFDLFEYRMENIVFAYTAIEAYANESVPADYVLRQVRKVRCEPPDERMT